jgi:hypothetical protein
MPGKNYSKRKRAGIEKKIIAKRTKNPSLSTAKQWVAMADLLGEKPYKPAVRTIKQAERAEKRAKKVINKKPLPPRSRSGAASGRVGGGLRGGRLGGGGAMNWSTK